MGYVAHTTKAITTFLSFGCRLVFVKVQECYKAIFMATPIAIGVGPLHSGMAVARGRSRAIPAISAVLGRGIRAVVRSGIGVPTHSLDADPQFGASLGSLRWRHVNFSQLTQHDHSSYQNSAS